MPNSIKALDDWSFERKECNRPGETEKITTRSCRLDFSLRSTSDEPDDLCRRDLFATYRDCLNNVPSFSWASANWRRCFRLRFLRYRIMREMLIFAPFSPFSWLASLFHSDEDRTSTYTKRIELARSERTSDSILSGLAKSRIARPSCHAMYIHSLFFFVSLNCTPISIHCLYCKCCTRWKPAWHVRSLRRHEYIFVILYFELCSPRVARRLTRSGGRLAARFEKQVWLSISSYIDAIVISGCIRRVLQEPSMHVPFNTMGKCCARPTANEANVRIRYRDNLLIVAELYPESRL